MEPTNCIKNSMNKRELGRLLVQQQRVRASMHECYSCDRHYTDPDEFMKCLFKCDVLQAKLDTIKLEIKQLTESLMPPP